MDIPIEILESISCNLCGSNSHELVMTIDGWKLVKCKECHFCFVNPRFKKKIIEEGYNNKNEYASKIHHTGNLLEHYKKFDIENDRRKHFIRQLKRIERYKTKGRILDVGCGAGLFLRLARERGWQTYGSEIGSWAKKAAEEFNLDIFIGTLSEANFTPDSFDVVYLCDVIEHLADPFSELQQIHRILKKDGLLVIDSVYNFNSIPIKFGLDNFRSNKPPGHLNYFIPQTIRRMVEKAGFGLIKISSKGINDDIVSNIFSLMRKKKSIIKDLGIDVAIKGKPNLVLYRVRTIINPFANFLLDLFGIGKFLEVYAIKEP